MDYIEFDANDLVAYIATKARCTLEQAQEYFALEEEYLSLIGVEENPEIAPDPDRIAELETQDGMPVVDEEILAEYIAEHSELEMELVTQLLEAEDDYMVKNGLV